MQAAVACALRAHAGYKGASDLFIDANVQLALAGARKVRCMMARE